jgi:hypothetical protein
VTTPTVTLEIEPENFHRLGDERKKIDLHYPSTTVYVVREIMANGEIETRVDAFVVPVSANWLTIGIDR